MMYFQSLQWGITVDGVGVSVKDTTIITDEQTGKVFISIADVAPHVTGYTYLHGEYGKNSEDNNSGVVQCNDEAVEFHANQNKINKVLLKEDTNDNEYGYMYLSEKINPGALFRRVCTRNHVNDDFYVLIQRIGDTFIFFIVLRDIAVVI